MAGSPITYAEETLGVHEVWKETEFRLSEHQKLTNRRAHYLSDLRANRAHQSDREAVIATEATGKYSDLSDTARTKVIKSLVHDDTEHASLRQAERDLQADLDQCDGDLSHHEKGIAALSARMVELGGLLQFYAAAKLTAVHTSTGS